MFEIKGKIEFDPINVTKKHHNQSTWKKVAVVKFDCDIYAYYAWFLEKRFNLKLVKPVRGTHVTIINDIVDDQIYNQAKELFNGKEISIIYNPEEIRSNEKHWWIKVYSDDIKNIRSVVGLNPNPYFGLHLTIGLANELQIDHSKYILGCILKYNL